ncbi:MAG: hypothetical protein J5775_05395 [Spirochaetales bacterium]|nr:hypothetical protein [Spirochaetales bacterium]
MKCCVIQPIYSTDYSRMGELFDREMALLDSCKPGCDIIVLPESSNIPAMCPGKDEHLETVLKYGPVLFEKCADAARRCNSLVFVNACTPCPETGKLRNTTVCFDRSGKEVFRYYKRHLTPGECSGKRDLDWEYSFEPSEVPVLELEGLRFAFLTCYDFYFYEAFSTIARQDVDIIIGCSHQRSDTPGAIRIIDSFLCYNTNAYLLRASVTFGPSSPVGGCSEIVSPRGEVLGEIGNNEGIVCADIDPKAKYFKPAGFNNPEKAHWQYIEQGRRPMQYRPGGPAVCAGDHYMGYPRLCAHRGYGKPENSLPSLAAAVALGAQEIEFDLRLSKDGQLVSIHDGHLERVSDGTGKVSEHTLEELRSYDFGQGVYPGLRICTFEEILKKLACHCVMNVHLKAKTTDPCYDPEALAEIWRLVRRYDCEKHVYFMSGNDNIIRQIRTLYPEARTCLGGGDDFWGIVDRAIVLKADKVQLVKGSFNREMIEKAHSHGILCNVYWSDDVDEAREYLGMGVDTILTNRYLELKEGLGI